MIDKAESTYDKQAREFLEQFSLEYVATEYPEGLQTAPAWSGEEKPIQTKVGPLRNGLKYQIKIVRPGGKELVFDFWGSIADREAITLLRRHSSKRGPIATGTNPRGIYPTREELQRGRECLKGPSAYDVLTCISSDQSCPESFSDFCAEYGYDSDSIKALNTYNRCSEFARKIRSFFTAAELAALEEIQ